MTNHQMSKILNYTVSTRTKLYFNYWKVLHRPHVSIKATQKLVYSCMSIIQHLSNSKQKPVKLMYYSLLLHPYNASLWGWITQGSLWWCLVVITFVITIVFQLLLLCIPCPFSWTNSPLLLLPCPSYFPWTIFIPDTLILWYSVTWQEIIHTSHLI